MPRVLCQACQRPEKACICDYIVPVNNAIKVVVLQHPSEVTQAKGTVSLLSRSLQNCQVLVGKDFSANSDLLQILANYHCLLLYPSDNAQTLNDSYIKTLADKKLSQVKAGDNVGQLCLIILDGTWKKAYRMFMLSSKLHDIDHICLPEKIASQGQYLIRKVAKVNALSSLEACCYALAMLEGGNQLVDNEINAGIYQVLLDKFAQFNAFQLSFRPQAHIKSHH
ncbi:tRNA-uridine aminocarboxypropyltransferase [Litorilituus sediminis]|uniref:tRNA-uridine aminocarboxypropyltransferase n=1 Tax=Litorilituus sediminis TaxID=718192 RepID=A0A4P6P187_9GAMM|nr:tRNA-uridine aminocarboxypropyltransferase [Litorilituus sediminis]QBG34763.1 DTW domain-containing protein [Litorilituus sediminis]